MNSFIHGVLAGRLMPYVKALGILIEARQGLGVSAGQPGLRASVLRANPPACSR
jgi:hypothetical protein